MRAIALAALFAGLSIAGAASAREWADPAGRLKFDAPNGWATTQERGTGASDAFTYVISGTANNECHFLAQPNTSTSSAQADAVRRAAQDPARFDAATWTRTLNAVTSVFRDNSANVLSTSLDSSQFWPIQRAEVQSSQRLVHASIQLRPGFDFITLCMTYDGADPVELYNTVSRSVGHPNDATFQADAERLQVERDAAAAAPAQPAPEQEGRRRNR